MKDILLFLSGFLSGFLFKVAFFTWIADRKVKDAWEYLWSFKWFTVTMVIVTIWNAFAFLYHLLYIGMDWKVTTILQVSALLMEYSIVPLYERDLIFRNRSINEDAQMLSVKSYPFTVAYRKYIAYTKVFAMYYVSIYAVRLIFLSRFPELDLSITKVDHSMNNSIYFMFAAGWLMGVIVISRKAKKLSIKTTRHFFTHLPTFFRHIGLYVRILFSKEKS
jgi:hypothetical protein